MLSVKKKPIVTALCLLLIEDQKQERSKYRALGDARLLV